MTARGQARTTGSDAGLTLLETLIVLAVIAVAAGATTLALAPRRGDVPEAEARLLAAALQAGADRALVTGAPGAVRVDGGGYAVDGGPRHALPAGVTLAAPATALPLGLDAARPFDLVVAGPASGWTVSFDGLRAVASPRRIAP